jgi:Tol biopolymer transport system component/predicted Ser/Thr protein kinase
MIGQTIGHYKITAKLGEGGMGEVFLAEDTKLDRKVALKFLPAHMSVQDDVKARFIQEAKAASALNHPNVCTIYDILEADGRIFIAMEYVDGQTLRDKRGTLSEKQTLEIAAQVADGLAAAHEKGIVHRDIKSENIMLRKDGIPQIMDFGLAKLRGVSRLTKEGSTLGTVGYMSPEQALGHDVDHRSDLFSFGVVLYELLTGELPFKGGHEAAIMYEIVNVDATPPSAVKPDTDPELDRIVLECLQKEPSERYQGAREIAKDLRRFKRDSGRKTASRIAPAGSVIKSRAAGTAVASGKTSRLPWLLVGLLAAAVLVLLKFQLSRQPHSQEVMRANLALPEGASDYLGRGLALSPDGRELAFVATDSATGSRHICLRSLDAFDSRPISGTERGAMPFWSPDGRQIGFFVDGKLKTVPVLGGAPVTICDEVTSPRGGTWAPDNTILFTPTQASVVHRVSASGGKPAPITHLDSTAGDRTHRWPHMLPDGDHFLFYARTYAISGGDDDAVCIGSLSNGTVKRLFRNKSQVVYSAGHLLFVRGGMLMAQRFDATALELGGDPFRVADKPSYTARFSYGDFTASSDGRLIYSVGAVETTTQILIVGRDGKVEDTVGVPADYFGTRVSPDFSRILLAVQDQETMNVDLWLQDLARDIRTRLTFERGADQLGAWSPDGTQIAFLTEYNGYGAIEIMSPEGTQGMTKLLVDSAASPAPSSWSADGLYLLYDRRTNTSSDVYMILLNANHEPVPLLATDFNEGQGTVSPNGRWMAYQSDESGRAEVYLTSFPTPGRKWQVSSSGGLAPLWRRDGRELYYRGRENSLMVTDVIEAEGGVRLMGPRALFPLSSGSTLDGVDTDGSRFVVRELLNVGKSQINLISNWLDGAEQR